MVDIARDNNYPSDILHRNRCILPKKKVTGEK